jgi:predicted Zn-dependent protease
MEIEADYIGILLLGAAGFHPQWALVQLAKGEKFRRLSVLEKFLSYHPKTEKRLQLLSQAKTMNEALELYREVTAMDKVIDRYFPYHVKV